MLYIKCLEKKIIKKTKRVIFLGGGGAGSVLVLMKLNRLGLDIVETVDMTSSDHLC